MHNAAYAERILARFTTPARASEMIGDLLESKPSAVVFWLSALRLAFRFTWRYPASLAACFSAIFLPALPYARIVRPRQFAAIDLARQHHLATTAPWIVWALCFSLAAILFASLAAFLLVRFGWRDKLAQVAALLAFAATIASCTVWLPCAVLLNGAAMAFLLATLLFTRARYVLCLFASVCTALLPAIFLGNYLATAFFHSTQGPGSPSPYATELIELTTTLLAFAMLLAVSLLASRLRSRFLLPSGEIGKNIPDAVA